MPSPLVNAPGTVTTDPGRDVVLVEPPEDVGTAREGTRVDVAEPVDGGLGRMDAGGALRSGFPTCPPRTVGPQDPMVLVEPRPTLLYVGGGR